MRQFVPLLLLSAGAQCAELKLKRFDVWESVSRSTKVYAFSQSAKLSTSLNFKDSLLLEAEFSPSKPAPAQVSLLFVPQSAHVSVGTFPSIQVSLVPSGSSVYRAELDLKARKGLSADGGLYDVFLLVGGESISAMKVELGRVKISPSSERTYSAEFQPLPVINHEFRAAHITANPTISILFAGLVVLVPSLIFLLGLVRLKVNVKGLSNLYSGLFFAGTIAYGSLLAMFFFALNLVQTVVGAVAIAVPMVFLGHKVLSQIRSSGDLVA